jgi:ATP-dependent Lon protease
VKTSTEAEWMPVLPLRDTVTFPGTVTTLHVAREASLRALRQSQVGNREVLLLSQLDMAVEEPGQNDLHVIGCICEALQSIPLPDGSQRLSLRGLRRAKAAKLMTRDGIILACVKPLVETPSAPNDTETDALTRECLTIFAEVVQLGDTVPPEAAAAVAHLSDPGVLADSITHHLPIKPAEKQAILAELDVKARLWRVLQALKHEEDVLRLGKRIHAKVETELGDTQRAYYLREQLRAIQDELQVHEHRAGETDEYRSKIDSAGLPPKILERADQELRRLDRVPSASPEGLVARTYLDTLLALPWQKTSIDRIDVKRAAELLDAAHYGLDVPKERIIEHLSVHQLLAAKNKAGQIAGGIEANVLHGRVLAFVGPPGVGKTSLGRSIAEAMGRQFVRIALGGLRDEAEIRGHRRTYVGSMPGRILQSLITAGTKNPVIVLDELDKLGLDGRGDTVAALLEVLDPEQNSAFADHYLEVPFDLSGVLFIATANNLDTIPMPLRDRLEIVPFNGYTDREKLEIARRFLLPNALKANGLEPDQFGASDDTLARVIRSYTREAGARTLTRQIDALVRKAARKIAEGEAHSVTVSAEEVASYLGSPPYVGRPSDGKSEAGTAWGLVVSSAGGDVLPIEVSLTPTLRGDPELLLTGNLGNVMKESAMAALTYLRSNGLEPFLRRDVHLHVPEGAIPKDGPSGGLAMALALASAAMSKPLPQGVAMTGEISLRGRVIGVGGLREKILAAVRSQMTAVLVPADNAAEIEELPQEAKEAIQVVPVATLAEALKFVGIELGQTG